MYQNENFKFRLSNPENYLFINGSRLLTNYTSAIKFTRDICKALEQANTHLVLIDYSNFVSFITYVDVFNIVRIYDLRPDYCKRFRISVIVDPDDIEIAKYWEDLCEKRGFNFKVFLSAEEGEKWLTISR